MFRSRSPSLEGKGRLLRSLNRSGVYGPLCLGRMAESLRKTRPVPLESKCLRRESGTLPQGTAPSGGRYTRSPADGHSLGLLRQGPERSTFPRLSARPSRQEDPGDGAPSLHLLRALGRLCAPSMCRTPGGRERPTAAQASVRLGNNSER